MKLTFYGAAQTVTGSKHLITLVDNTKILLDCGFFQGRFTEADFLNRNFDFNPAEIDLLILSHAHIDHCGNIPQLVKKGFRGKIYCTNATYDLCKIMLKDSGHIQEADFRFINKIKSKKGKSAIEPMYTVKDAEVSLNYFSPLDTNRYYKIRDGIELLFTEAGHILGSSVVNLKINEKGNKKRICFTGDVGRYNTRIVKDPQPFPQTDILICETTYGGRTHPPIEDGEQQILDAVLHTCGKKRGKLIIPAFSIGRTQEIVYALDKFDLYGLIPEIKVFVDSPLSTSATEIFRKHSNCFNRSLLDFIEKDSDPFGFDKLRYIQDTDESIALNTLKEPCIIISASGMAEAGRIKHHIKNNINNPNNTILLAGYAEPSTLAGKLKNGDKEVIIFGDNYKVNAEISIVDAMSAHADSNELIRFLSCQNPSLVSKVFLVHGRKESQDKFKETLQKNKFKNIFIPERTDEFEI